MFFNLKTHIMSQKKIDSLGQTDPINEESKPVYVKGSIVEYLRSRGIKSKDTTHEKIGQTTLMFTNSTKPTVVDDSLEASLRYLKYKRF